VRGTSCVQRVANLVTAQLCAEVDTDDGDAA